MEISRKVVMVNLPVLDANAFNQLRHVIGKCGTNRPIAEVAHMRFENRVDHEFFIVVQNSSRSGFGALHAVCTGQEALLWIIWPVQR